jgi:hypothetical protein
VDAQIADLRRAAQGRPTHSPALDAALESLLRELTEDAP